MTALHSGHRMNSLFSSSFEVLEKGNATMCSRFDSYTQSSVKHLYAPVLPCISMSARRGIAASPVLCSLSTFWVITRTVSGQRAQISASAQCAGFGAYPFMIASSKYARQNVAYHSGGFFSNFSRVPHSYKNVDQTASSLPRNVGTPDATDTPAPVINTTRFPHAIQSKAREANGSLRPLPSLPQAPRRRRLFDERCRTADSIVLFDDSLIDNQHAIAHRTSSSSCAPPKTASHRDIYYVICAGKPQRTVRGWKSGAMKPQTHTNTHTNCVKNENHTNCVKNEKNEI